MSEQTWLESNSQYREVELTRPIRVRSEDVTKLRLREPRMDDIESLTADQLRKPLSVLTHVVSRVAGIPPSSARLLSARDIGAIAEALRDMGFTPSDAYELLGSEAPSEPTGETGSE